MTGQTFSVRRQADALPKAHVTAFDEEDGLVLVVNIRLYPAKTKALARAASVFVKDLPGTLKAAAAEKGLDMDVAVTSAEATGAGEARSRQWLNASAAKGEARLVRWTEDGTLVPVSSLEATWKVTRQAIDLARKERGELFSLFLKGQHWYPGDFLRLRRVDIAQINQELGDLDPVEKLLFLLKKHGSLGNRTPAEAVEAGMLEKVLRAARSRVHS